METSLADLLKILLSLDAESAVYATPSFRTWLRAGEDVCWPPPAGAESSLVLVDTRDRAARNRPADWLAGQHSAGAAGSAALVLAGSGRPGTGLRRMLRRIRRPGTRRLSEAHARRLLAAAGSRTTHRLAFDDGPAVPTSFDVDRPQSTGAALLVSDASLFSGPLWAMVARELGGGTITLSGLHLRARGAAVALVRSGEATHVVRVVPAGPLQDVVVKNHAALSALRRSIHNDDALVRRIPVPGFSERFGTTAVLAETCLPGVLAWKVARGTLAPTIRSNALAFLKALRHGTAQAAVRGSADVVRLIREEQARLEQASFASRTVRRVLSRELTRALDVLGSSDLQLYASHGDYGYGNILVDPATGALHGVIDWDTSRALDLPATDRVNLEIQIQRTCSRLSFPRAVAEVWRRGLAADALGDPGSPIARALFGAAVCRYVSRSFSYPALYPGVESDFERALKWLERTGPTGG